MTAPDLIDVHAVDATSPATVGTDLASVPFIADTLEAAAVVGLGWTARTVRDLQVVAHGVLRLAVEHYGYRSVLLEGDVDASADIDGYVQSGDGDPAKILAEATPYLSSRELLDMVAWVRSHNERHPERTVRFVHGGRDDEASPLAIEESLDEQLAGWHRDHEAGIVYIGGAAHVAIDPARRLLQDPQQVVPSAGALLRDRFGDGYRALGLTFGSGRIPVPVPRPARGSLEAELDHLPHPTSLVRPSPTIGARPMRLVGPRYDPADDAVHAMVGDPATWFLAYVHQRVGHPATPLSP